MRTFADSLISDLEGAFLNTNEFAQQVTYRAEGEDDVTLSAIVSAEQEVEDDSNFGLESKFFRDVRICRDPSASCGGVATPRLDATVIVPAGEDGTEYSVHSIPYLDTHTAKLRVVRIESIERSRPNYRG